MAILVKAYIRQLFGSPEIQVFEFDSNEGTVEDLKKSVSDLVGGRTVELAWIDQAGDRIQLSNDDQLKLAVSYGVKDNVLRISARVDWLGVTWVQPAASTNTTTTTTLADEDEASDEVEGTQEDTEMAAEGDTAEANGDGDEAAKTNEAGEAATAGAEKRRSKRKCARRQCPGKSQSQFSGYVRTVGPDGVTTERNLTAEEAAYLLNRTGSACNSWRPRVTWSTGSLFSDPLLEYRRPTTTPLFLAW